MTEFKTIKEILKEEMRAKGINTQKLSELTGIAPRYIKALMDNDISQMPPSPYVKGYLENISKILEIDFEPLWQEYKKESELKTSGAKDTLPLNRYAPKSFNKKTLFITIFVLIILVILIPKISNFIGKPSIEITSPPSDQFHTSQDTFVIEGKIDNPQDKLSINSGEVVVNPDGTFKQSVVLSEPGCRNDYDFTVKRFLGSSVTIRRTICYDFSQVNSTTTINNPQSTTTTQFLSPSSSSSNIIKY